MHLICICIQFVIAGLVSQEETCEEILKDIYYGAAKVIHEEAKRWADVTE